MRFLSKRKLNKLREEVEQGFGITPPDDTLPKVIKVSAIKPTTCRLCHSIYQAHHKHIQLEKEMFYTRMICTICPVCGCANKVEFEGDDTNGGKED